MEVRCILLCIVSSVAFSLSADIGGAEEQALKPGPEHELLKQFAGDWKVDCRFFPPESEDAIEYSAEYTAKMDVGGFFLISQFNSKSGDQPFQGRGFTTYDPYQKKYVGVWIQSSSPTITNMRGEWDTAGRVYTEIMRGTAPDGQPMKVRMVTEFNDANHMRSTMFGPALAGKQTKTMEMSFTRKE